MSKAKLIIEADFVFLGSKYRQNRPKIRKIYDHTEKVWRFSMVDIVSVIIDTDKPSKYWYDFKKTNLGDGREWKKVLSATLKSDKIRGGDGRHLATDTAVADTALKIVKYLMMRTSDADSIWIARRNRGRPNYFTFATTLLNDSG